MIQPLEMKELGPSQGLPCARVSCVLRPEEQRQVRDPAWVEKLDKTSWGPFQPQPFCNYVAKVCPYYFAVSTLPAMLWAHVN